MLHDGPDGLELTARLDRPLEHGVEIEDVVHRHFIGQQIVAIVTTAQGNTAQRRRDVVFLVDKVGKAPGRDGFQQRRHFQGIDAGTGR